MRTPEKFKKNLDRGIITEEMLDAALHSVNKRAKNWRNRKRRLKRSRSGRLFDPYYLSDIYNAETREKDLYAQKEILLSVLNPVCIHKEFAGYFRTRVYDYEKSYNRLYKKKLAEDLICWENFYIQTDEYGIDQAVYFFDYIDPDKPQYRYYLFYECGENSYHQPIDEAEAEKCNIPILQIDQLDTDGENIRNLISLSFVKKMLNAIKSGKYQYIPTK